MGNSRELDILAEIGDMAGAHEATEVQILSGGMVESGRRALDAVYTLSEPATNRKATDAAQDRSVASKRSNTGGRCVRTSSTRSARWSSVV